MTLSDIMLNEGEKDIKIWGKCDELIITHHHVQENRYYYKE